MSLDKAIAHNKEHRKPYTGAKAVDPWCRNHGRDEWATSNRLHKYKKKDDKAKSQIDDLRKEFHE